MRAAFITAPGAPETIQYGELPDPVAGDRQVVVRVEAVAVNPIDTYIRSGMIKAALPSPYILGCDFAGEVAAVGRGVTDFKVGDKVWGSNQGLLGRQGCFAELAAVDQDWVYPRPEGISAEAAAATALVGITAHLGLVRDAQLQAGETLFVVGGTGGVGSMVVQMGKALGARVITCAGSAEKVDLCRSLGADVVIPYAEKDIYEALAQVAPTGVNVFWETRRTPDFQKAVPHLAVRGRFVLMAGREATPVFPVGPFYTRDCKLLGFAMFNAPAEEQRRAAQAINRWLAGGQLRPLISQRFPLAEAAAAHRLQEESTLGGSGKTAGKIILTP